MVNFLFSLSEKSLRFVKKKKRWHRSVIDIPIALFGEICLFGGLVWLAMTDSGGDL